MKLRQLVFLSLFIPLALAAQEPFDTVLTISGDAASPVALTMSDVLKLPHSTVRAMDHDRHDYDFEGVDVYRVLSLAGIKFADTLRGKVFSSTIMVVRAADNYQAVFTLAELDPTNSDKPTILAFRQDGKPLSVKDGPLRVISPGEKRHIRWVRQVKSLIVQKVN